MLIRALAVLTAGLIVILSACSQADRPPGPAEKVTIAIATPPFTVLADLALARDYFRQQGLEVTPHFHSIGKEALDDLLSGKADFATVAETPVMFAVMKGQKISMIATIARSRKTNVVIARKDRGISAPSDLKGKLIAASLGTTADYYLNAFLTTHGVMRRDIKIVDMKADEMVAALAEGRVDAVSAWPPYLERAEKLLGTDGISFHEQDIYTQTFNLVAMQDYVRANPTIVRKVLLALAESEKFCVRNPAESQRSVSDLRKIDKDILAATWGNHSFDLTLDQHLLLFLEDESRWAMRNKLVKGAGLPNYLDTIYFDGLKSVKPDGVRILR
ncbi:MAG TPA: NrtA/SsuA/CpmA family ABC transporter substrate-binding protein [Dissulfurispiraceae bacterium]|nr:NrtA/SsuA/CpmA family ABC transporter substrate-binding protein [Dissulfurispiraceae bacterium]